MKRWNKLATPLLTGIKLGTGRIAVWCPFCRKYHFHGWDHARRMESNAEHRGAHCDPGSPFYATGYYIAVAPPLPERH